MSGFTCSACDSWQSAPAFASVPKGAAAEKAEAAPARFGQAAQTLALGAALAVDGAVPAFAEGVQYPGLPYVLVFGAVLSPLHHPKQRLEGK